MLLLSWSSILLQISFSWLWMPRQTGLDPKTYTLMASLMPLSFRFLSVLDQIFTFQWILACAKIFSTVSSMIYLAVVSLMINRLISTCGVLFWRTVARFAIGALMLDDGISLTGKAWGRPRICMFSMQQALLLCCMIWSVLPLDGIE